MIKGKEEEAELCHPRREKQQRGQRDQRHDHGRDERVKSSDVVAGVFLLILMLMPMVSQLPTVNRPAPLSSRWA